MNQVATVSKKAREPPTRPSVDVPPVLLRNQKRPLLARPVCRLVVLTRARVAVHLVFVVWSKRVPKRLGRAYSRARTQFVRQFGRLLRKKPHQYGKPLPKLVPPRVPPALAIAVLTALRLAFVVPLALNRHLQRAARRVVAVAVLMALVVPPLRLVARALNRVAKKPPNKARIGKKAVLGKVQKVVVLA